MTELQPPAPKRELKPCPFCGAIWGTGLSIGYKGQPSTSWHVYCVPCKVMGPDAHGAHADTAADAIDKWNQRFAVSDRAPSWNAALELAEQFKGRADDAGKLARAMLTLKRPETSAEPAESDANGKSLSQVDNGVEVLGCRPVQTGQGPTPERYLSAAAATVLTEAEIVAIYDEEYVAKFGDELMHDTLHDVMIATTRRAIALSAPRSGTFAEGYEAAREDAAQFLDDADEHELAYQLRALPPRERK